MFYRTYDQPVVRFPRHHSEQEAPLRSREPRDGLRDRRLPLGFQGALQDAGVARAQAQQGWRLVEQTSEKWYPGQEPGKDQQLRWNKPKASTYWLLGGAMYLDGQGHVQSAAVGQYSKPAAILE